MKPKELLEYQDKLKRIYLNSHIPDCYITHLQQIFGDGLINRMILQELRSRENNKEKAVFCIGGLYPRHLQYSPNLLSRYIYTTAVMEMEFIPKKLIKIELLRKIFLLTLENFLSKRKYGVDFRVNYRIPLNSIQFTTEYHNSGLLYRKFFKEQ